MPLSSLTDEERRLNLKKAQKARKKRVILKDMCKAGEVTFAQALVNKTAARVRVTAFLAWFPGIGRARAQKIIGELGISPRTHVQGLGIRQREKLSKLFEGMN